MNDDVFAAAARLNELQAKAERYLIYGFGSGPYAIMGIFDDGSSRLKAYGFDTIEDARLFLAFANRQKPDSPERMNALMEKLGYDTTVPTANWLRFDVVRISVVVDDLQVPRG